MTAPVVFYHQGCPDGFCAAWVFRTKFPQAEFIPVSYGEPAPKVRDRDVWVLDFHFKRLAMTDLRLKNASVRLLDHHETAARELDGFEGAWIDTSKSGARLTLEEFYGKECPSWSWVVDYTEDRDLWRNILPRTHEINAAIASYHRAFPSWDDMVGRGYGPLIEEGKGILRYKRMLVARVVSQSFETVLGGHRVKVANCGVSNFDSEVAGALSEGRPFGAVYSESNGRRKWSLRSGPEGLDVAAIAEHYGGGGHRHAAAFFEKSRSGFWQDA